MKPLSCHLLAKQKQQLSTMSGRQTSWKHQATLALAKVQTGCTRHNWFRRTGAHLHTGNKFAVSGPYRTRLGNYTQINGKTIAVSGTRRAVDQAGVADEYAYQLKKRGTELRRDVEFDMVHSMNTSNAVGTQNANARSAGGYQAFINSATTVDYVGEFQAPSDSNNWCWYRCRRYSYSTFNHRWFNYCT
jgi:hypothetical protein